MTLAVVTGATSGIGYSYARHLAGQRSDLVVVARSIDRLEAVATELARDFGVSVTPVGADLAAAAGVSEVIEAGYGATVVVANAGSSLAARAGEMPWPELGRLTHLLGPGVAQLCEGLIPQTVAGGSGRITIVASIGGLLPMPKSAVYSAASGTGG